MSLIYFQCSHSFLPASSLDQLQRHLSDLLLASVLGRLNVLPLLLDHLTSRLKEVVSCFTALVPEDFYLPAPPVYCPQPAQNTKQVSWREGRSGVGVARGGGKGNVGALQRKIKSIRGR